MWTNNQQHFMFKKTLICQLLTNVSVGGSYCTYSICIYIYLFIYWCPILFTQQMMPQTPGADTLTLSSRIFNRNRNCLSVPGSFLLLQDMLLIFVVFCFVHSFTFACHRPDLCPMFPVSLDCLFLITSSVFSTKGLKLPKRQSEAVN